MRRHMLAAVLVCTGGITPPTLAAGTTAVAHDGKSLLPIVTSSKATPAVQRIARALAHHLQRITDAEFAVEVDKQRGVLVGLPSDFNNLPAEIKKWDNSKPGARERYLLRSTKEHLYVIGATELAVENAVWDLLHRIGYRQYFPGKHWEVIPKIRQLSITVDADEMPDYYSRRIWYGFGPWDYARQPYEEWCAKNRVRLGFVLRTGHAYSGIIRSNQKAFDAHPEFYAFVKGKRNKSHFAQLCISNPALRELIAQHAVRYFDTNPDADSISMDPNDGGGWCECEQCKKMGSVSTRVITLANQVAEAINQKHDNKFVGLYAYASHSPPPAIRVHPNVVVSVATAFIRGGFTLDELVSGWSKQGATLGIREYYSVHTWDRDLPGRARGARLDYLIRTIPEFHAKGARYLSAESSDNWGPNGLGYYLAARILWDADEAKNSHALIEDFLTRCFGEAKEPMAKFYGLLDGSEQPLVFDDHLGRMFRHLDEAKRLAKSSAVQARINDLILYARYVDLYDCYRKSKGDSRQEVFEKVIRHGYRMRETMMIHTKALYRDVVRRDKDVSIPKQAQWGVPEARNPWKSSKPFTDEELRGFLAEGIAKRQLAKLDFEPKNFSSKLVPASSLALRHVKPGSFARGRGTQTFYLWTAKAEQPIELTITGGLIAHYRDRGNVRVHLWKNQTRVASDQSVPPDGKPRKVHIAAKTPGMHRMTISDGGDLTSVQWKPGTKLTRKSSRDEPIRSSGRWSLYFYVPKGTKKIGLFASGQGSVIDPQGRKAYDLPRKAAYHSIPVGDGHDGKLWKIQHAVGSVRLLNVPPYFARTGDELLLPQEVVRKDAD